jgi:hypothetical protein
MGEDLRSLPLHLRKTNLARMLDFAGACCCENAQFERQSRSGLPLPQLRDKDAHFLIRHRGMSGLAPASTASATDGPDGRAIVPGSRFAKALGLGRVQDLFDAAAPRDAV